MAGGKIVRIVGGTFTQECETLTYYQDNFTINAGGKIELTTDGEMIFGEPEEPRTREKYIVRGWWSSDREGSNKIRNAYLGDTVFFHIETKNIDNDQQIATRLIESNSRENGKNTSVKLGNEQDGHFLISYRKIYNDRILIELYLNEKSLFSDLIEQEEDKAIELFFACSYREQNIDLPLNYGDYLEVRRKLDYGGAFLFILTDELLPSGKIVRKVVVPPANKIVELINGNKFERFGMSPPNPLSNISIGEHASGFNQSKYLSGSSLSSGAPNISGTSQYIDITKAKAAGCKIYSTKEVVADLKRLQKEAPTPEAKARLDKVINAVSNIEKEVLIKGEIPPNAIKSSTSMRITKGLRIVSIIGMVITAYELEQATEKSINENSFKPITAEAIRQVGGWGGAIAGAKIGGITGAAIGIETGPGAVITGAIGALIVGIAGYFGADWVADFIDEN